MTGEFSLDRSTTTRVLELHPDVLASAEPYRGGLEFLLRLNLPGTSQIWHGIDEVEPLHERVLRDNSWTHPDGRPVDRLEEVYAETFDGSTYETYDNDPIPSVFSPGFFDIATTKIEPKIKRGYSAVQCGNIRDTRMRGLDFSIWARAAFRSHLETLSDRRLENLGIDDPQSFDIRDYLEQEQLTPDQANNPAVDPVFREYLLFHHEGVKTLLENLNQWHQTTFPERTPPFYLDQPMGDPYLWECAVAETYASEHVDLVSTEDYRTMPADEFGLGGNPNRVIPEKDIRDFVYKLMWATARHEKPVQVWDAFGGEYYSDIDSGDEYPMLLRLQAAEAYAMGCQRRLTLRDAPFSWKKQGGRLPEVLKQFIDFLWAHQRFLRDAQPENRVAIVWSVPTLLWNTMPQWGIHAKDHTTSFHGTATLLRESQIPYDVIVFGQGNLWPDAENLKRLLGYDAIILPGVEGISRSQLSALDDFLAAGGLLVASGTPPDRNESFEPIGEGGDVFDHDNVVVLESDPGRSRITDDESEESMIAELTDHGIGSVTTKRDNSIGVNHLIQHSASRHLIHLLNYDYDPGADEFERKRDVEIRLDGVPGEYSFARYYSPQGIEDLEIDDGDSRRVTVPELVEWGFLVLAPTEAQIDDSGSRETANELLTDAEARVRRARTESSRTMKIIQAELKRDAAMTALEYREKKLAISEARRAIEIAESLVPTETPSDLSKRTDTVESPGQPGFGVLSALIATGGGIFLLSRLRRREEE